MVNQAYAIVVSDENQRSVAQSITSIGLSGMNPSVFDVMAMYTRDRNQKGRGNYNYNYNLNVIWTTRS